MLAAVSGAAAIGVAQAPQGQRSQGALQSRPGADREPEFPIPNIRQYKPKSTLVVPQHPVPRAKFPVIDIHSHQPTPITEAQFETLVQSMDPLNLQVLVNARVQRRSIGREWPRWRQQVQDRMVAFAAIESARSIATRIGEASGAAARGDVKPARSVSGKGEAIGCGSEGDGTRMKLDDPTRSDLAAAAR